MMVTLALAQIFCSVGEADETATPDPNRVSTVVAQTLTAQAEVTESPAFQPEFTEPPALPPEQLTQMAPEAPVEPPPEGPPAEQPPAEQPPADQPPPDQPGPITISVSADTNCRVGPSSTQRIVGFLAPGQVAAVLGRNAEASWWLIETPGSPGQTCWLWGQYAILQGDSAAVPVVEP